MTDKKYVDPEWLRYQYWTLGLSIAEMATDARVTDQTIHYWMKKHGIERRESGRMADSAPYKNASWLRDQYADWKSIETIADDCGVDPKTIHYYMEKYGIERRSRGDWHHRALYEYLATHN